MGNVFSNNLDKDDAVETALEIKPCLVLNVNDVFSGAGRPCSESLHVAWGSDKGKAGIQANQDNPKYTAAAEGTIVVHDVKGNRAAEVKKKLMNKAGFKRVYATKTETFAKIYAKRGRLGHIG